MTKEEFDKEILRIEGWCFDILNDTDYPPEIDKAKIADIVIKAANIQAAAAALMPMFKEDGTE